MFIGILIGTIIGSISTLILYSCIICGRQADERIINNLNKMDL